MKFAKVFIVLLLIGCDNKESKELRNQKDLTTIRCSYYLSTVVHDDHLFILSKYGYFIHHMDCPCLKTKTEEKTEPPKVELPTGNILDLLKGNRP